MLAPGPCRRSGRSPDATGERPDASGRCRPPLNDRSRLTQAVQPRSHRVVRDAGGRRGCDRHAWCTLDHFPVGWSTPRGCSGQLWIIVTGVGPGRWMGRLPGFPEHMIAMVSANKQDRRDTPDFANRRRAGRGDPAVLVAVESRSAARIRGPTRRTRQSIIRVGRRTRVSGRIEGGGSRPLARAQCSTLRRLASDHSTGFNGLPAFQPSRCSSIVRSAASANVGTPRPRGSPP